MHGAKIVSRISFDFSPGYEKLKDREVLWIADDAPWIWNMKRRLCPHAHELLDYYHVMEHAEEAGKKAYGEKSDATDRFTDCLDVSIAMGRDTGGVRPGERTYSVQAEKTERQAKSQSVREFVEVLAEEPQPLELSRVFVEELADRQRWDRKRTQVRASETNETVRDDDVVPRKRSENGHHESS